MTKKQLIEKFDKFPDSLDIGIFWKCKCGNSCLEDIINVCLNGMLIQINTQSAHGIAVEQKD